MIKVDGVTSDTRSLDPLGGVGTLVVIIASDKNEAVVHKFARH